MYEVVYEDAEPKCSASGSEAEAGSAFSEKFEAFLENFEIGRIDLQQLEELVSYDAATGYIDWSLVLRLADWLRSVCTNDRLNSLVKENFFALLKRVFQNCPDFGHVMVEYYAQYQEKIGRIPNWKEFYKNFDSELTSALNSLGSHVQFQGNEDALKKAYLSFAWLFFIAPKPTTWALLKHCFESKQVVPSVLKVLRNIPALKQLTLNEDGSDIFDKSKRRGQLILCALRRMLHVRKKREPMQEPTDTNWNDSEWERYIYLVVAFSRERRRVLKEQELGGEGSSKSREVISKEVVDEAFLTGAEVMKGIVMPEIFSGLNVAPMLEIALRVITCSQLPKISPIRWSEEVSGDRQLNETFYEHLSAPLLIRLALDLYCEHGEKEEISESLCLKLLSALGQRLNADKVVFGKKTVHSILSHLNGYNWALKYAVVSYLNDSLGNPKLQIPTGLYKALGEDQRQYFEQIVVDFDYALSDCFLRSLFELADIAPQLATELIQKGFTVLPSGEELSLKIAYEFMAAVSEQSLETNEKFSSVYDALKCLLRALQSPVKPFIPTPFSESAIYGLRLIEPLAVLGNAILIARDCCRSDYASNIEEERMAESCRRMVDKLLEHFCRLTKDHLEKELQDLRRSRLKYVPNIRDPIEVPDGVRIDRLNRVFTQVSEMFFVVSMIAKFHTELPNCLKILLVKISQYQKEVMEFFNVPSLDDLSNDSREGLVFYAYANHDQQDVPPAHQDGDVRGQGEPEVDSIPDPVKHESYKARRVHPKRTKALAGMNSARFNVTYSEVSERENSLQPSTYFTRLARQVPDHTVQEAMLRNISGQNGLKKIFSQAVDGIRKQGDVDEKGGHSQQPERRFRYGDLRGCGSYAGNPQKESLLTSQDSSRSSPSSWIDQPGVGRNW